MAVPESLFGPLEDGSEPTFSAPWEAQAFAITVSLHASGLFTWDEWAATLSGEIGRAQDQGDPDRGDTYYRHWQKALERISVEKGLTSGSELDQRVDAWRDAYLATPHGQPVALSNLDGPKPD